jgi:hypothetical protein
MKKKKKIRWLQACLPEADEKAEERGGGAGYFRGQSLEVWPTPEQL